MNVQEAIEKRFSCRSFTERKISDSDKEAILKACLNSQTGLNMQELMFNWIENKQYLNEISRICFENFDEAARERMTSRGAKTVFYDAPALLVISSKGSYLDNIDAGIAAQSICLTATELGLNSCIIQMTSLAFDKSRENMCDKLGFEKNEKYMLSVALGYGSMTKEPHKSEKKQIREFL